MDNNKYQNGKIYMISDVSYNKRYCNLSANYSLASEI